MSINESLPLEYMLHGILEAKIKICFHMMHMEVYLMAKPSDHKVDVCYLDTFVSAPTSCRI